MKPPLKEAQTGTDRASGHEFENGESVYWMRVRFYIALAIVILVAGILDFSLACNWSKFSRAEVFFAESAREMIATNNFVTPLYHNKPFFDKPALTYWLIILMFKNFGYLHLAARVPSIFAGLATVALTGLGGALPFHRRVGIIAASVLCTSCMFFAFSALCMSDMLLVLFDLLSLTCLYAGMQPNSRRSLFFWLASVSMGLAFLTKGPVGVVLPIASFLGYLTLTGRLQILTLRDVLQAIVTIGVISTPWFIAAYQTNGWEALNYFFIHENVQRFTGTAYDAHRPAWYTLISLFTGFAPWSILLPFALFGFILNERKGQFQLFRQANLFLWTWIAVTLGFFSLSHGKCDYYTLPAFPAAALLVGQYVSAQLNERGKVLRLVLLASTGALLIAGLGCGAIAAQIVTGNPLNWILAPAILIASSVFIGLQLMRERWLAAFMCTCGAIALSATAFSMQVLPAVLNLVPIDKYASFIKSSGAGVPVVIEKGLYSWGDEITFLTGRHPLVPDDVTALQVVLDKVDPCIVIVNKSTWQSIPQSTQLLSKFHVISEDSAITKPLTPGLALSTGGKMTSDDHVLLLSNY
jgi:4-amino-4-deoxy-L-arabinose transferase-like glycosyltransferase